MYLSQYFSSVYEFIKKDPTRCNNVSNFIIPYLYEAQHVSGYTPPIIRSLKLHWQPLAFHTWKVVCTCSWWTLSGHSILCPDTSSVGAVGRGRAAARPQPTALLPPRSNGKTRGCYCSCWAPDDGREDARNMFRRQVINLRNCWI